MTTVTRLMPYLSGLVTAILIWLAFPGGGGLAPLLFAGLVPLFITAAGLPAKKSFAVGLLTGFTLHLLLIYWIVTVLGQYGGLPVFVSVPALFLLAFYMSIYWGGAAAAGGVMLHHFPPAAALVAVPLVWVGLDWLRGVLFSGFPWMDLAYGLAGLPRTIQVADLLGHSGVTFLVVLANTCVALLVLGRKKPGTLVLPVLVTAVVCGLSTTYSMSRYRALEDLLAGDDLHSMKVGIVQGNIDQSLKWSEAELQRTLDTYLLQSARLANEEEIALVVWPETALPFYPASYDGMDRLFRSAEQHNHAVLTGAPWYEIVDLEKREVAYYNSAQLLLPGGTYGNSYYKSHLVPFGEYVPMRRLLPFLEPLVEAVGDFSAGEVEEPLKWREARIGVLICFESIFPDIGRQWVKNGANVLVNLTNDAWYGKSSAPYQSMAMTSFRAVENRRSIIRSANTGISGFIDPLGRVDEPSPIFMLWSGAADVVLLDGETFFVRWGYLFAPVCFFTGLLLTGAAAVRGRERNRVA